MGISDIDQVLRLFSIIQNIQIHGALGDEKEYRMWVNVNQIYDNMNNPKMQKPMIRDFCEQQVLKNNLEKQTGKDKFVRQAQAEYQMTEKGKRLLAIAKDDSTTSDLISMISWTQNQARKRKESKKQQAEEENPKEDKN